MALSPNHPLAQRLAENDAGLAEFIAECNRMGTSEAVIETAEKRGYATGLEAVHPFDPTRHVPVYVANFVLMEYGTGAIFGCPAHDQRDLDFARKYGLPVIPVVLPPGEDPAHFAIGDTAYTEDGTLFNSDFLDGLVGCRRQSAPPASGSKRSGAANARSPIACATGASRGSAIGAARSRSSIAPTAASCRCRRAICR